MTTVTSQIDENLQSVRQRIAAACARCGRSAEDVQLVAVTKYAEPAWVRALLELGVRDLGESRPQQLVQRAEEFCEPVRWHLIGHLQRNKVRPVLPPAALIHAVDSFRLLSRIEMLAGELQLRPRILLEVNVSGEPAKQGFRLEELLAGWSAVGECRQVRVEGLMTMAPRDDGSESARPVFRGLRELRDRLADDDRPLRQLSMGMSGDFETAVEEGATVVRIGSKLFENCSPSEPAGD